MALFIIEQDLSFVGASVAPGGLCGKTLERMNTKNEPNKIILHHSASPRDMTTFAMIDKWHEEREFYKSYRGYFVGYHYVILHDGEVVRAKGDDEVGCHTLGQNLQSIGICLAGNFNEEHPTDAQEKSLVALMEKLVAEHKISYMNIFPHRKFSRTDCFGKTLTDEWARNLLIQKMIEDLISKIEALKAEMERLK